MNDPRTIQNNDYHIKLPDELIQLLQLSDNDISDGKLILQDELDKNDLEWLKSLEY